MSSASSVAARYERRDPPHGDASVLTLRRLRVDLEIVLAIALRREVFGRHAELVGKYDGDSLRTPVREAQVVFVRADRIGVSLDQKHLVRIAVDNAVHRVRDALERRILIGGDAPRTEIEVDDVKKSDGKIEETTMAVCKMLGVSKEDIEKFGKEVN